MIPGTGLFTYTCNAIGLIHTIQTWFCYKVHFVISWAQFKGQLCRFPQVRPTHLPQSQSSFPYHGPRCISFHREDCHGKSSKWDILSPEKNSTLKTCVTNIASSDTQKTASVSVPHILDRFPCAGCNPLSRYEFRGHHRIQRPVHPTASHQLPHSTKP